MFCQWNSWTIRKTLVAPRHSGAQPPKAAAESASFPYKTHPLLPHRLLVACVCGVCCAGERMDCCTVPWRLLVEILSARGVERSFLGGLLLQRRGLSVFNRHLRASFCPSLGLKTPGQRPDLVIRVFSAAEHFTVESKVIISTQQFFQLRFVVNCKNHVSQ